MVSSRDRVMWGSPYCRLGVALRRALLVSASAGKQRFNGARRLLPGTWSELPDDHAQPALPWRTESRDYSHGGRPREDFLQGLTSDGDSRRPRASGMRLRSVQDLP